MTPEMAATIALLEPEDREAFHERAALREFDGKLMRQDAEERAFAEITAAIIVRRRNGKSMGHQAIPDKERVQGED